MNKIETFLETDKLSVILNLALDDLELVDKDSSYIINMRIWHYQYGLEPCTVCLAGSVLAKTFNVDRTYTADEDTIDPKILKKLYAINYIREGKLSMALHELDLTKEQEAVDEITDIAVTNKDNNDDILFRTSELILGEDWYDFKANEDCDDFNKFIKFYRGVANKLKEVGL